MNAEQIALESLDSPMGGGTAPCPLFLLSNKNGKKTKGDYSHQGDTTLQITFIEKVNNPWRQRSR